VGLIVTPHIEKLLAKARWRRQLNLNGYEGRLPVATDRLAEALRAELRDILDNGGRPFDILVAQHLYDFAIAAKDLLVVSAKTVADVVKVVADVGGAMESLAGPNEAPPIEQQAETFGARMMREILAILPMIMHKSGGEDPRAIVAAIADARERQMPELAAALERKLLGIPGVIALPAPKITRAEVIEGSFEHGFADGCMQDKFARRVVNGACAVDEACRTPAYQAGYEAGCARRASEGDVPTIAPSKLDELMEKLEHVPDAVQASAEISEETARALLEGDAS
jgi:hypothetical protein